MTDFDDIKKARIAKKVKKLTDKLSANLDFQVREKKFKIIKKDMQEGKTDNYLESGVYGGLS